MQRDITIGLSIWLICSFFLSGNANRNLETEVNPNCGVQCEQPHQTGNVNLVYTRSVGSKDTVHHLWSTQGAPSLLVALTSPTAELNINWTLLLGSDSDKRGAISFTETPSYAFGLVLTKLFQYRDPDDLGIMGDDPEFFSVVGDFATNFTWGNVSDSVKSGKLHSSATFRTTVNSSEMFMEDGYLALELDTRGEDGRSEIIPRLLYSANSTQLRLILNKIRSPYDNSRFGVEVAVLTMQTTNSNPFHVETLQTMDDEYTPGVFKTIHLLSDAKQDGGYASWKPVAYTTDELTVTGSTNTVNYDLNVASLQDVPDSVAKAFFGGDDVSILGIVTVNVSFGMTKDDYYINTNYTEWTLSCGLGLPGKEELSSLVKIVIASGLGLPALLMIASGVYLGYHKLKRQRDDLHLSRR